MANNELIERAKAYLEGNGYIVTPNVQPAVQVFKTIDLDAVFFDMNRAAIKFADPDSTSIMFNHDELMWVVGNTYDLPYKFTTLAMAVEHCRQRGLELDESSLTYVTYEAAK